MVHHAKASHIGSCLSMADLLAVLYGDVLRVDPSVPDWPERDRLIVSKGHAAAAMYAVLAACGFFPRAWLDRYCDDGELLTGHISHKVPGIEVSTGSLGHGLSIGCGLALAAKRKSLPFRVFVLLSDGELDEGANWEAILFAGHHGLDNLTAIIDYNGCQGFGAVKEILDMAPLADKWRACHWAVREVDGHDHGQIASALSSLPFEAEKLGVLVAQTVKGKGVCFMEDQLAWHYKSPDGEQLSCALNEVGCPE